VLSAEIRQCLWRLLRLIVVCNNSYYKKTTLQDLDAELDLFVKHELKCSHYLRYMDDFVLIHSEKSWLRHAQTHIEAILDERLRLQTNNRKTQIFPVSQDKGRALDFLGYQIYPIHRRLRRSSIRRITRSLKRLRRLYAEGEIDLLRVSQTVQSWIAHARHADTLGLRQKLLDQAVLPLPKAS